MNTAIIGGAHDWGFAILINSAADYNQLITARWFILTWASRWQRSHPILKKLSTVILMAVRVQASRGVVIVGVAGNSPAESWATNRMIEQTSVKLLKQLMMSSTGGRK